MATARDRAIDVLRRGTPPTAPQSDVARAWAESGAMALTGAAGEPALEVAGASGSIARRAAESLQQITGVGVDGPALLGERAAILGLRRRATRSCGGGAHLLPCGDGWWAVNLAHGINLVPALTEQAVDADPETAVARWSRQRPAAEVVERAALLGMAASALGETVRPRLPWQIAAEAAPGWHRPELRVVNLGALWAGPLAAQLLSLAGAQVEHVESTRRPDPGRDATPAFYELLREGASVRRVDLAEPGALHAELAHADVVIEASRPRALRALGADAETIMRDGRARIWLRVTGHPDGRRIAFGDDAAVAGGLVGWREGAPVFAADAIADPLTGLLGGLAISAMLVAGLAGVIDMSLAGVAAYCAGPRVQLAGLLAAAPRVAARTRATRPAWAS